MQKSEKIIIDAVFGEPDHSEKGKVRVAVSFVLPVAGLSKASMCIQHRTAIRITEAYGFLMSFLKDANDDKIHYIDIAIPKDVEGSFELSFRDDNVILILYQYKTGEQYIVEAQAAAEPIKITYDN